MCRAGGKISFDKEANAEIYGPHTSAQQILGAPASTHRPPEALRPLYAPAAWALLGSSWLCKRVRMLAQPRALHVEQRVRACEPVVEDASHGKCKRACAWRLRLDRQGAKETSAASAACPLARINSSAMMCRGARRRYTALEELAAAADGDVRRFGGFRTSWRAQIKEELRIKGRSGLGAKGTGAAAEG